ncbi:MAG: hypothetical protein ACE5JJ_09800 [Nitrospinota bacterium]
MGTPGTLPVGKAALWALLGLILVMAPPPARTQTIPDVPDRCCGYRDCRRARTAILSQGYLYSRVLVDGKTIVVPATSVHWSDEGWYCGWDIGGGNREACPPGKVSSLCAICVVIARPALVEFQKVPRVEVLPARGGRKLLIPVGRDCSKCHS